MHGDHDTAFKALNSQLKKEVLAVHSGAGAAHSLQHGALFAPDGADGRQSTDHWVLMGDGEQRRGPKGLMEATARLSGRTLAQLAARDHAAQAHPNPSPQLAAAAAAAAAAEARWMQGRLSPALQAPGPGPGAVEAEVEQDVGHTRWRAFELADPATEQAEAAARQLEE